MIDEEVSLLPTTAHHPSVLRSPFPTEIVFLVLVFTFGAVSAGLGVAATDLSDHVGVSESSLFLMGALGALLSCGVSLFLLDNCPVLIVLISNFLVLGAMIVVLPTVTSKSFLYFACTLLGFSQVQILVGSILSLYAVRKDKARFYEVFAQPVCSLGAAMFVLVKCVFSLDIKSQGIPLVGLLLLIFFMLIYMNLKTGSTFVRHSFRTPYGTGEDERQLSQPSSESSASVSNEVSRIVLFSPRHLLFGWTLMLITSIGLIFTAHFLGFAKHHKVESYSTAGFQICAFWLAATQSRFIVSFDRLSKKSQDAALVKATIWMLLCCCAALVWLGWAESESAYWAVVVILGFFYGPILGYTLDYLDQRFPSSLLSSLPIFLAMNVFSLLIVWLTSVLEEWSGDPRSLIYAIFVVLLLSVPPLWFAKETMDSQSEID